MKKYERKLYSIYANVKRLPPTFKSIYDKNSIILWWHYPKDKLHRNNWGDAVNPLLVEKISGKSVIHRKMLITNYSNPVYIVCGSVLGEVKTRNAHVWGAGFIRRNSVMAIKPQRIDAVRGPLTRELLLKQGLECPKLYGDPALLFPKYYNPKYKPTYKLGIIPHLVDMDNPALEKFKNKDDVLIVDILSGLYNVPDQINKCERIASSSLHGMILADAYGIPSIWLKISDRVVGEGFKFYDYLLSVGRKNEYPLVVNSDTSMQKIIGHFKNYKISIDLEKLLEVCPFAN